MISVLYVDDETGLLDIAKLFLEKDGEFQVATSISALESLASPDLRSYDAIISDYQMPGMDGIAFLKAVREQCGDIPFILFTGRGREEVVIDAINNGADFYLQKGGDPRAQFAELAHKIRQSVRRKQAERSLFDSERRLADIIDFLPDATFAIDQAGRVIAWNRAIEEMTGVPAAMMLGKGDYEYSIPFYGSRRPILIDLIDGEDNEITPLYTNVFRIGAAITAETDLPHPKGHRTTVLAKVCHLYNQAGEITGTIESIRDITERKRLETDLEKKHLELQASYEQISAAEEELRDRYEELARVEQQIRTNEARLAMAQEISHTGSWEYNIGTDEIWGSSEGLRIFGFHRTAGSIPINDIESCIMERKRVHQALIDLLAGKQQYDIEYVISPADGSAPRTVRSFARLEKNPSGTPIRVVGVVQDISDRKKSEQDLKESESFLNSVIEQSPYPVWISDSEGTLIRLNPACREMLQISDEDVVGKYNLFRDNIVEEQGFMPLVRKVFGAGETANFPLVYDSAKLAGISLSHTVKRTLSVTIFPIKSVSGRVTHAVIQHIDITKLKEAELGLRRSEEKYRLLTENTQDILYSIDPEGRITHVSSRVARYGYSPDQLTGRNISEIISEEDLPEVLADMRTTLATEKPSRTVFRLKVPGKNPVWFEDNGTVLKNADGEIVGISGIIRDITERREAEVSLRESEEKFHRLAENARDMIYRMSLPEGNYEYVSPASTALTGYSPEEFYTDPTIITRLIHPAWRKYLEEQFTALLRGNVSPTYEFQIIDRAGRARWINQRNVLVTGETGALIAIEAIVTDITAQKDAERELRRSEQRFLAVSSNSGSWIWEVDAEGMYRYSSPASEQILGYRPEELVGKVHFHDLFDPSVREDLKNAALAAFSRHEPFRDFINLNRHKDGRPVLLRTSGTPVFDEDGIFAGYRGIDEDITGQKQAEDALKKSRQQLEDAMDLARLVNWEYDIGTGAITFDNRFFALCGTTADREGGSTMPAETYAREFVYPDDRHVVSDEMMKATRSTDPEYVSRREHRIVRRDGEVRHVLTLIRVIRSPEGRAIKGYGTVQDITEQKRAEEVLRESEERFRGMAERSSDLILILNKAMSPTYVSPSARSIIGYEPEELAGKPPEFAMATIFRDTGPDLMAGVRKTTEGLTVENVELRLTRKNGDPVYVSMHVVPVLHEGVLTGAQVSMRDITAGKKAEMALRESEQKFRAIVETSPGMIWEIDPRGTFRYISPIVTDIMGYAPEELIGKPITDLVRKEGRFTVQQELARHIGSNGPIPPLEVPAHHKDGRDLVIEIRPSRLNDSDGNLVGFRGVAVDITERRRSEEALRKSRHQLAEAMDIAHLADWEYNVATNLFTFNDRFYALYGTTAEREGGMQMTPDAYAREFMFPEDRCRVGEEIRNALNTTDPGYLAQAEHRILRRDGAVRHIIVRIGVTLDENGRVIKTHGANQDITDRKQAEKALARANKQLALLGSVTRHDTLNKISIILGYLNLAGMKCTDPAVADLLRKIESNTIVVRSQMEFTRAYQDLGAQEPEWIDLDTVMPRPHVPPSIALATEVLGISLYADPMLEKVFFNLLDNAIRHGERVTEIRVSARRDDGNLLVVWEDNGTGVAANEKERIFERGFGRHTGLGMFLAREILALTGITITETGEPGKGARFEIRAPNGAYRIISAGGKTTGVPR